VHLDVPVDLDPGEVNVDARIGGQDYLGRHNRQNDDEDQKVAVTLHPNLLESLWLRGD